MAGVSYQVRTDVFEGPLDLLYQLISQHQVSVNALSLTDLVSEYLSYLDEMRRLDLEITSEFLLIAATLIQLKARSLLPSDEGIDVDEELALMEERDRLLSRLLASVTFKDVAAVLAHRFQVQAHLVPRTAGLDPDIQIPVGELRIRLKPAELAARANKVLGVRREITLDHLDLDLPSVQQAMDDVRVRLAGSLRIDFEALVEGRHRRVEVAAYFLAILELARWGLVELSQARPRDPIRIELRPERAGQNVVSEWTSP